jgi:hypothetical protein
MSEQIDRLAGEIRDLRNESVDFRVDFTRKQGEINADIIEKLGVIDRTLEGFKGRVETKLNVAQWIAGAGLTIVILVMTWAFADVQRTTRLEESVRELRDTIKGQAGIKGSLPSQDGPSKDRPVGQLPPGETKKSNRP